MLIQDGYIYPQIDVLIEADLPFLYSLGPDLPHRETLFWKLANYAATKNISTWEGTWTLLSISTILTRISTTHTTIISAVANPTTFHSKPQVRILFQSISYFFAQVNVGPPWRCRQWRWNENIQAINYSFEKYVCSDFGVLPYQTPLLSPCLSLKQKPEPRSTSSNKYDGLWKESIRIICMG